MNGPGSPPHRAGIIWPIAVALFGACGAFVSTLSTLDHIGYRFSGGDSQGFCDAIVDSGCASAHASDSAEIFGVPISMPGTAFYMAIVLAGLAMAWLVARQREGGRPGGLAWMPAAVFVFGLGSIGYSAWLASVLYRLGQFCPFCFVMYCANAGIVVTSGIWAWPGLRRIGDAIRGTIAPAFALGMVTLLLLVMTVPLYLGGLRSLPKPPPAPPPKGEKVAPARPNGLALPDRVPMRGNPLAPATIVEFSDLECPHCAVMHHTLSELYQRQGPDRLNIRYVHYPPDTACNCYASVCVHKTACLAAKAAICSAREGLFWEYSDLLYNNRTRHQMDDLTGYAREVGISTDRFFACMNDPGTDRDLLEDIEAAHAVGVKATPTVVINGVRFEGAIELDRLQELLEKSEVCACDVAGEVCPTHGQSGSAGACNADVEMVGDTPASCQ